MGNCPWYFKITNGFDGKRAHGYDMVRIELLQKLAQNIVPDIARLIKNSLKGSILPVIEFCRGALSSHNERQLG